MAPELPQVLISPIGLHQILLNLCVNARDAMAGSGVVELSVDTAVLESSKTCDACHQHFSGDYLVISVRDSGHGIDKDNILKIFDPFFTTKEVGRGSGLGLSVLHGIVHAASGHIEVLTAVGVGTEFRIYLPAHARVQNPPLRELKAESKEVRIAGKVMVVDDESSIVGFITTLLQGLGCQVTGLTDPHEALRLLQENPHCVDLVLTDQTMPEMTGWELSRAMLALRPELPIVMMTGYSNSVDEISARRLGIARFLVKPVPAKVLMDIVTEYLGNEIPGAKA